MLTTLRSLAGNSLANATKYVNPSTLAVLSQCTNSRHSKNVSEYNLGNGVQNHISKRFSSSIVQNIAPQAEIITRLENTVSGKNVSEIQNVYDTLKVLQFIQSYQQRGFLHAKLDPLDLPNESPFKSVPALNEREKSLDYKWFGFNEEDLDRNFEIAIPGIGGFCSEGRGPITLRQLIKRLDESYCGSYGVEYAHITNPDIQKWLKERLETVEAFTFDDVMKKKIFNRTLRAQLFEHFCQLKFPTAKRFGADGVETVTVCMKEIVKRLSSLEVDSILIGMAHRGRLNILTNIVHKPMKKIMSEFQGMTPSTNKEWGASGDVKYHLGVENNNWDADNERYLHVGIVANPSHLEAVNPVVLGQARAQQYYRGDQSKAKVVPICIHGDASVQGQGVVYESLQMALIPSYSVGGTIHVVCNNQVGFTTDVIHGGSGKSCCSLAKSIEAPIFHVNADDPEAVTLVARMAAEYRQTFKQDVFINLIGYRRYGHNEMDMPKFTQPLMYTKIAEHPPVLDLYSKKLLDEGVVDQTYINQKKEECLQFYNQHFTEAKSMKATRLEYPPHWNHMARPDEVCHPRITGVDKDLLLNVGKTISTLPASFNAHLTLKKLYENRLESITSGHNLDYGTAEALAFGTLLTDGFHIRLAGQDCQRGTFSHRHAVLHDQVLYKTYFPLQELKTPHSIEVCNSLLSEYAALGFEYGFAQEHPDTLNLWEAQFGDFANGAQIIIDQFIASGETKWGRQNGLVMLLPHGFDGMGPEHSSARIERFLTLCDDREDIIDPSFWDVAKRSVIQKHNLQVVYTTTPANYFHVLRRQMIRGFRKPLIVFLSKKLLKLRQAVSNLDDLVAGTRFMRYIPNVKTGKTLPNDQIQRLVLCSGQVYYDLIAKRDKTQSHKVAIARVEQLSPFPFDNIIDDLKRYPNLQSIVWCQEEPMNNGPWNYVSKRIVQSLKHIKNPNNIEAPIYIGRNVCGAPATGDAKIHEHEQDQLLREAMDLSRNINSYYELYLGEPKTAAGDSKHRESKKGPKAKK